VSPSLTVVVRAAPLSRTIVFVSPVSIAPVAIRIAPTTTATRPPSTAEKMCDLVMWLPVVERGS
jgi:hypothetical protein